jgi:phosphoserine phosphatase RsbU/P
MAWPTMKIPIVDDNSRIRASLKSLLGTVDIEFYEAADGLEGIEQFNSRHPDLVLMDYDMPSMNGIEAMQSRHKNYNDPLL